MNINVHFCRRRVSSIALQVFAIAALVVTTLSVSAGKQNKVGRTTFTDSITIKSCQGRKNQVTKLYLDANSAALCFSSTGNDVKAYQIYLFNMDGKLVTLARVGYKETTLLVQLEQGNYLYEVFSNDDRIENGSISLK